MTKRSKCPSILNNDRWTRGMADPKTNYPDNPGYEDDNMPVEILVELHWLDIYSRLSTNLKRQATKEEVKNVFDYIFKTVNNIIDNELDNTLDSEVIDAIKDLGIE